MKLFKQANVYAPEPLGIKDVLIAGGKIIQIADDLSQFEHAGVEILMHTTKY